MLLLGWPEPLLILWSFVTPEARDTLPDGVRLGVPFALLALAILARFVRQKPNASSPLAFFR